MNFNLLLLMTLMFFAACGVKGDPVAPKSPQLPSLMENYPDIETEKPIEDHKKPR